MCCRAVQAARRVILVATRAKLVQKANFGQLVGKSGSQKRKTSKRIHELRRRPFPQEMFSVIQNRSEAIRDGQVLHFSQFRKVIFYC